MGTNMRARASIVKSPEAETPPLLHGDGVTDDTDAVQWYLDRRLPLPSGGRYSVHVASLRDFVGGYECVRTG